MKSKPFFYSLILFLLLFLSLLYIQNILHFNRVYSKGILSISNILIPKQLSDPKNISELNLRNLFFDTLVDKNLSLELIRNKVDSSEECKDLTKRFSFVGDSFSFKYELILGNVFLSDRDKLKRLILCEKKLISITQNNLKKIFESKAKSMISKNEIENFIFFSNEVEKEKFMKFYDLIKAKISSYTVDHYQEKKEITKISLFKKIFIVFALSFLLSLSVFYVMKQKNVL